MLEISTGVRCARSFSGRCGVIRRGLAASSSARKVALVTGGAKRIGREICLQLARNDYDVLIHCNRSVKEAGLLVQEIEELSDGNARAAVVTADFSVQSDTENLAKTVRHHAFVSERGGLDALVLNASTYETGAAFAHASDDASMEASAAQELGLLQKMMQVHVVASHTLSLRLVQELRSSGNGSIVSITDTSLGKSWQRLSAYSSSKAALQQLMKSLAGDLAPRIRCNVVSPGAILPAEAVAEDWKHLVSKIPLRRSGTPAEIASAVLFLISNGYMNGHTLVCDGGLSLQ